MQVMSYRKYWVHDNIMSLSRSYQNQTEWKIILNSHELCDNNICAVWASIQFNQTSAVIKYRVNRRLDCNSFNYVLQIKKISDIKFQLIRLCIFKPLTFIFERGMINSVTCVLTIVITDSRNFREFYNVGKNSILMVI